MYTLCSLFILKDPEGTAITYQLVAGDFPPGIRLFGSNNKMIGGIIPDTDATYTVTIRATDGHGKYADAVFRMVVRGRYMYLLATIQ